MAARYLLASLAALGLCLGSVAASAAAVSPHASATAFGVRVVTPAGGGSTVAMVSTPPPGQGFAGSYAYPADGSIVVTGAVSTSARTGPGASARASATATAQVVTLFGGEITVAAISVQAEGVATRQAATGDLSLSGLGRVAVLGQPVEPSANRHVALGDWGYAVLLEEVVLRGDDEGPGYRGFVTGLHVYLTAEHGGLPAGSEILVGYAESAVQGPQQPEPVGQAHEPGGGGKKGGTYPAQLPHGPTVRPPGAVSAMPAIVRNPPPGVRPHITGAGYVFPVYGPVSFSDDFGAPRADTGWHHGNDIFAALGAPVLAVADGVLFSVGWNDLGGHRLWLRDRQGNEYYYAHLSAYSPLAFNGSAVHAGDVIGFVGDSGDAQGTPYHLHFEIHPSALLGLGYDGVVNPYAYLVGWQRVQDVSFAAAPAGAGLARAPEPAATLLDVEDISTASGLEPGALERAFSLPVLLGESVSFLVRPTRPPLVGAAPGFFSLR